MAAEALVRSGLAVQVLDGMPSAGRKFLLAGRGGLNLTHAEPRAPFGARYGERAAWLAPRLAAFEAAFGTGHPPDAEPSWGDAIRAWAAGLGIATFVGSSGRVFPHEMKAAPLLRAWLHRLRAQGVVFQMRRRWTGWDADGALVFADGSRVAADATVLALGGASWPRLGSDGAWQPLLAAAGVPVAPLVASNVGFEIGWTEVFRSRFAGAPLKNVAIAVAGAAPGEPAWRRLGECVVSDYGLEGSLVYAASAPLRQQLQAHGRAAFTLDLLPGRDPAWVRAELARPRGTRSLATHLKSRLGLDGAKAGLVWECTTKAQQADPAALAAAIQALPLVATAMRPIEEAISSAGGVRCEGLDERQMLLARPGVFVAGEMIDWDAPTGGYLLTACLATGWTAGQGAGDWLYRRAAGDAGAAGPAT